MERIKIRPQSLLTQMVAPTPTADLSANETKARAYSQQGHGKQHKPIQRPDTYQRLPEDVQLNTCEQQPVHTLGSFDTFAAIGMKVSFAVTLGETVHA